MKNREKEKWGKRIAVTGLCAVMFISGLETAGIAEETALQEDSEDIAAIGSMVENEIFAPAEDAEDAEEYIWETEQEEADEISGDGMEEDAPETGEWILDPDTSDDPDVEDDLFSFDELPSGVESDPEAAADGELILDTQDADGTEDVLEEYDIEDGIFEDTDLLDDPEEEETDLQIDVEAEEEEEDDLIFAFDEEDMEEEEALLEEETDPVADGLLLNEASEDSEEPVSAEGTCGGVSWRVVTDEDGVLILVISGNGSMHNHTYNGALEWQEYSDSIEKIVIEEDVKGIGEFAFCGMKKVKTIDIPMMIDQIGDNAFVGCIADLKISYYR